MISCDARALAALIVLSSAGWSLGCSRTSDNAVPFVETQRTWLVPAADVGVWCADVDDVRACWDGDGRPALIPRTLPSRASVTPLGYRCYGQGAARTCAPRDDVGAFDCNGDVCTQTHPRQPDDGQWQCSDDSGVTVCVGGEPAAGTPRAPGAPGWVCGNRGPHTRKPPYARVCVDLSPDFPGGSAHQLLCRWRYETALVRECKRAPVVPALADRCSAEAPCVSGASCVNGRCLPPKPIADCAIDADCERGSCRFGSCREGAT